MLALTGVFGAAALGARARFGVAAAGVVGVEPPPEALPSDLIFAMRWVMALAVHSVHRVSF